jgi:hypothetical protein
LEKKNFTWPAKIVEGRAAAAIGDVVERHAGAQSKHFETELLPISFMFPAAVPALFPS